MKPEFQHWHVRYFRGGAGRHGTFLWQALQRQILLRRIGLVDLHKPKIMSPNLSLNILYDYLHFFSYRHDHPGTLFHLWQGGGQQVGGVPGTAAGRVHRGVSAPNVSLRGGRQSSKLVYGAGFDRFKISCHTFFDKLTLLAPIHLFCDQFKTIQGPA